MYSPMLTQPHLVLITMLPRNSQLVTSRRLIVGQLTALRGRCYLVFPGRPVNPYGLGTVPDYALLWRPPVDRKTGHR